MRLTVKFPRQVTLNGQPPVMAEIVCSVYVPECEGRPYMDDMVIDAIMIDGQNYQSCFSTLENIEFKREAWRRIAPEKVACTPMGTAFQYLHHATRREERCEI